MTQLRIVSGLLLFSFILNACKNENTKKKSPDEVIKSTVKNNPGLNAGTGTYSITGPEGWTQTDTSYSGIQATFIMSPSENPDDEFRENVNVVTENGHGVNVETYFKKSLGMMKNQLLGFSNEGVDETRINGLKAISLKYSFNYSGRFLSMKAFFLVRDNLAYVITCTARKGEFSKWEPAFNNIVNSFNVK